MTSRIAPYAKAIYQNSSTITRSDAFQSSIDTNTERFPSLSAAVRYPYSPCWPFPYPEGALPGVT